MATSGPLPAISPPVLTDGRRDATPNPISSPDREPRSIQELSTRQSTDDNTSPPCAAGDTVRDGASPTPAGHGPVRGSRDSNLDLSTVSQSRPSGPLPGPQQPQPEIRNDASPFPTTAESSDDEAEDDDPEDAKLEDRVKRAPKHLAHYSKYIQLMEDRINYLEEKFRKLESRSTPVQLTGGKWKHDKNSTIPELRYVKWDGFKNKYAEDEQVYAIDVLVGPARYWYQRRKDEWMQKWRTSGDETAQDDADICPQSMELPERIRINSRSVLTILSDICSGAWSIEPQVFLRPYKLLVRHEEDIRDVFRQLQSKWAHKASVSSATQNHQETVLEGNGIPSLIDADDGTATEEWTTEAASRVPDSTEDQTRPAIPENEQSGNSDEPPSHDMTGSWEAYRDMQCLVDFMDVHIKPVLEEFRSYTRTMVQFHELWYMFKAGDIIYSPKKAEPVRPDSATTSHMSKDQGRYQTLFKVSYVDGGRARLSSEDKPHDEPQLKDRVNPFQVAMYYIDYDGTSYGPIIYYVDIPPFEGLRSITSLEAYPLEYAENHSVIFSDLLANGKKFKDVIDCKHMSYTGPTYTCNPSGSATRVDKPVDENYDSEVIVDFTEARKHVGGWIYDVSGWVYDVSRIWSSRNSPSEFQDEFREDYPVTVWKDRNRKEVLSSQDEIIFKDDSVDIRSQRCFFETDPFLKAVADKQSELSDRVPEPVRSDDLILLTSRVVGRTTDGFKDLKLPRGHKEMVQALVRSHSVRRHIDAGVEQSVDYDVVRGKGRGLIILLHGVPGVGKTSTAECVAESTGKPLFPITCGDLGLTPQEVEGSLRKIFQLAQVWDCVLLLDEADVFLAQRTKTDLKRNALVSVFLRVLEYYTGILFLTTNRVGAFDEAFKSRIHISLYYPDLVEEQFLKIWEMNLERTKKVDAERIKSDTIPGLIIAEDEVKSYGRFHYKKHYVGVGKWNGRQIRNAFQTASALALYEAHKQNMQLRERDPNATMIHPRLTRKEFQKVAKATIQFDRYMEETIGKDDAAASFARNDRSDQFTPDARTKPRPMMTSYHQHHPAAAVPHYYPAPPQQHTPSTTSHSGSVARRTPVRRPAGPSVAGDSPSPMTMATTTPHGAFVDHRDRVEVHHTHTARATTAAAGFGAGGHYQPQPAHPAAAMTGRWEDDIEKDDEEEMDLEDEELDDEAGDMFKEYD